ncbi:MAG: AsmA family protein [Acidobacteria bacterium]|nr:AsmA family protein [Acidobacteriota bacterium]
MLRKVLLLAAAVVVLALVAGTIYVRSRLDPERVRQTLEQQASAALGQPVHIERAALTLWPRAGVDLTGTTVGEPALLTLAESSISTSMRALFSRQVVDAEILINDSTIDLPGLLAAIDRLGVASGSADAPPAGGLQVVSVRRIAFEDVRLQAGPHIATVQLESSLDGDRLTVDSARIVSDGSTMSMKGVLESVAARRGRLEIDAETLNLDGLLAFAQQLASRASSSPAATAPVSSDLTVAVTAREGQAAGVRFQQLATTIRAVDEGIRFEPFAMDLFGGRLQGTLAVDAASTAPGLRLTAAVERIDMTQVTAFAGQPGSVTGTLSGEMTMTGSGAAPHEALAAASGRGRVVVTDGTVKGLQVVRPIVLAFGKPDLAQPADGGEAFSRMAAEFTIARGVVTFQSLTFDSRDVELRGQGTLALNGARLDIAADAKLSRELTAQAGRDLVRYAAADGQVTVPATVTGTVEQPSLGVDVGSLAQRAVTNEIKRQTGDAIRGLLNRRKK